MAKKTMKKIGRRGLAVLMMLVMAFSLLQITALAAGELICTQTEHSHNEECYETRTHEHGDECYKAHEHNRRTCERELHEHSDDCGFENHSHSDSCYRTHEHDFGCRIFGCDYDEDESYLVCGKEDGEVVYTCGKDGEYEYTCSIEKDLICGLQESYQERICGLNEHSHSSKCYKEEDTVDHLDIHINLTAKYTVDGKSYDAAVILTGADYTSGRLTITSTGNRHNITRHGDSVDAGQYRFHGTFPVGSYANPVNYTITLLKNVDFNVEGETVTIPMTFSKTVNYWTDNICESLLATRGYKNGSWAAGEFVGGHMDFKLGASEATGSTDPVDPETPDEPVKYTLTVQKNVSGITLDAPKAYSFGVYNGNAKVDTIDVTVAAGGSIALGTTALDAGETYFVVEEGNPDITGYTLSTSVAVGTADAEDGTRSSRFTLNSDTSVVFTNSYEEIQQPPVNPEPDPVTYTLVTNWVDEEGNALADSTSETKNEGDAYATEAKSFEGYELKETTGDATSGVMDDNKEVNYVYKLKEVVPPQPPVDPEPDPVTYTLVTNWVDEEGNALTDSTSETKNEGDAYATEAKSFEGYELKETTGDAASGVMDSNKEVNYVYKLKEVVPPQPPVDPEPDPVTYTLVTNWVDEEGNALADSTSETKNEGDAYATEAKSFEGYELKETTGDAASGVMDDNKEVNYVYKLKEVVPPQPPVDPQPPVPVYYTLTVSWVDEDGNALTPQESSSHFANSPYTTVQKSFEGYSFVQTSGDAVSGVMNSNKAVTYIYKLDEIVEIPDEDPPLVDIPDEEPPLVDIPEEDVPLVDIPDEDVPMADVPKTGDNLALYVILAVLSGLSLAALALTGKKKTQK